MYLFKLFLFNIYNFFKNNKSQYPAKKGFRALIFFFLFFCDSIHFINSLSLVSCSFTLCHCSVLGLQWRCSSSTSRRRVTRSWRRTASTKSGTLRRPFGTPFPTSTGSARSSSFAPSTPSPPPSTLSNSATPFPKVK